MKFPIKLFNYAGLQWRVLNQARCCRSGKSYTILFGIHKMEIGYKYICFIESFPGRKIISVSIGSSFVSVNDDYFNSLMLYA